MPVCRLPVEYVCLLLYVARGNCSTYLYTYAHRSSIAPGPDWIVADHAFEVPLIIGEPFLDRFPDVWSESDKTVSLQCMLYWTNFAKTGYVFMC